MSSSAKMNDRPILAACFICGHSFSSSQVGNFQGCKMIVHAKCMTPQAARDKICPKCNVTHEGAQEGRVHQLSNASFPGNPPQLNPISGVTERELLETMMMLIDQKWKLTPNCEEEERTINELKQKIDKLDKESNELTEKHKEVVENLHEKLKK